MSCSNLHCYSLLCVCGSGNVFVNDITVTALSRTHRHTGNQFVIKQRNILSAISEEQKFRSYSDVIVEAEISLLCGTVELLSLIITEVLH